MTRGSLVGRLIWLAAGWSVALLAAAGVGLSAFFYQAALSEFDQGLSEDIDSLYAGSVVTPDGQLTAPALTDARATATLLRQILGIGGGHGRQAAPGQRSALPLFVGYRSARAAGYRRTGGQKPGAHLLL